MPGSSDLCANLSGLGRLSQCGNIRLETKPTKDVPRLFLIMMLAQLPTAASMFLFPTLLNSNIGDVTGKESIALPKLILESIAPRVGHRKGVMFNLLIRSSSTL